METALQSEVYNTEPALYMAFELSDKTWRLVFGNGRKVRGKTVEACARAQVMEEIAKAKKHFKLPVDCRVISCYEAGWEGFWLARWLRSMKVTNYVLDSSAIEVSRKKKQVKTDRIDGEKLLSQLVRYEVYGDKTALHIVRVPGREDEDNRRLHRERDTLVKERGRHWVRIKSLLRNQGLRVEKKTGFVEQLDRLRSWDGSELPAELKAELQRQWQRYVQVDRQIKDLEALQKERVNTATDGALEQIQRLMKLKCLGWQSAWALVMEFFAWRKFRNRRELASLSGLVPTPYNSGDSVRDQGISKAGNRRVRTLLIELAWMWLRYQPQSKLSQWFCERFAKGGKRQRRIGIVALARRLLVALWRFLEHGELPEGAVLKA